MSPQKIYIIGIGDDGVAGLTVLAQQLIDDAEIIVGPSATLAMVTNQQAQHVEIGASFDDAVKLIGEHPEQRIVVLATGDPLFYGIARYLCGQLGKERFEVVPHVSTMQLAF
ncbi:MAG: cobalt-precorrin-7 (C(5))-methyltransferase, partial [Pirellulales bacterium]|nr:cobalt-precorrin-7 (C(5))-methyltransferase [Pirellulales bacterium]